MSRSAYRAVQDQSGAVPDNPVPPAKIGKLFKFDIETIEQLEDIADHFGTNNQTEAVRRLIKDKHKIIKRGES